jgi:hypothetical protein
LNTRLIIGLGMILIGILILAFPALMQILMGAGLILVGLYVALQNAPASTNI